MLTALSLMLLVISLPVLVPAQENEFANGILDVDKVLEAAKEVTREKYPNADDVLLDDYILVRYEADGTSLEWDDTFMKILTEKGKRDNTSLSFYFTLPYSTTEVLLLQVIKPDGTIVPVDVEKQSRVMVDPSQMSSNIYNPNSKILRVGVPGLEVGDIVRYVSHGKLVKPRVPDTWSDYQVLEYTSPIKHYVYEVQAPQELPLRNIALKDEVPGTVKHEKTEKDGRIHYKWTISDVPRMYSEPSMPPLHTVVQRLLVSTIPSWEDISKWYWNLSEPHYETTPEIKTTVKNLVEGIDDDMQKIEIIFKWVSQEIRYMGITIEAEAPGYEPHDVSLTFKNRHGVCRDKAALLVVMLREAGLKGYPVLIHNGPKKDEEVPQPYFNHAVVAVEIKPGEYVLMDPTDENTKKLFPAYLNNQSYLVAKPEGEELRVSPIDPARDNMMRISTEAAIDADGVLTAKSVMHFEGINDNAYRGYFSRIKPEERRKYFDGVLKRIVAGGRMTHFELIPENMQDTSTPLQVTMEFKAEDVLIGKDKTIMMPVPSVGASVGMVNFILGRTGLEKREYPLVTDLACGVEESLVLTLDESIGQPISIPEYPSIDTDTLGWQKALKIEDGTFKGENIFLMKAVEFNPEEYLELKEILKDMEYNARKKPIFKRGIQTAKAEAPFKPEAAPDVRIIEARYRYELTDAHTWEETVKIKKQVLTYKGKKDNSEIKFNYNPAWEEIELTTATVSNGDSVQYISEQEINELDAGWAGSAPRYPAAKTLVASMPGVEEGSVIYYEYTRKLKDQPFFAISHNFRGSDPIDMKMVQLIVPKSLELDIWKNDSAMIGIRDPMRPKDSEPVIVSARSSDDETVTFEWTVQNQKAVPSEDSLPPWWSFNPNLMVSTGNWEAFADHVRHVLMKATHAQSDAAAKAREIAKDLDSKSDKVIAIRDFVAKNIRDAGPGLSELPFTAVTDADTTLEDGYGNTTDRAVLIHTMLKAVGISSDFMLASRAPEAKELSEVLLNTPDPSYFGTVLVRVRVDGDSVFLNDTDQYDILGATSHDDRAGLLLKPKGWAFWKQPVRTIDAPRGKDDHSESEYDIELLNNGDAIITKTRYYYGNSFGSGKKRFDEMAPEERKRYYQEAVAGISQAAKAQGDLTTNFNDYPGVESFTVKVERYAVVDGDYMYLDLPYTLRNLFRLRSDERTNPIYWSGSRNSEVETEIKLPAGWRNIVFMPDAVEWDAPNDGGEVEVEIEMEEDGVLEIEHEIELDAAVISADDYDELLEINQKLSQPSAGAILLRRN